MAELHRACALLIRDDDLGRPTFAGTCFAFRQPGRFLTAAHCIKDASPEGLSVAMYLDGKLERGLQVRDIATHPTADLAALTIADWIQPFEHFIGVNAMLGYGDDVASFGFPEDSLQHGIEPVPRLFRGFVQRLFDHDSHLGHRYVGAELSFGAPGGLSGGPLILSRNRFEVAGVITENIEASTYLRTVTEVRDGAQEYIERIHSVITYGIAVVLEPLQDWLDTVIASAGA